MAAHSVSLMFDWEKCIFCQEVLRSCRPTCPADSKRPDVGLGYSSLAETINGFRELGQLPECINLVMLDEGDGIEATCQRHRACWHKKCRNQQLHASKLDRLRAQALLLATHQTDANSVTLNEPFSESGSDGESRPKVPRLTRTSSGSIGNDGPSSRAAGVQLFRPDMCIFCDENGTELRQILTENVDIRVRQCADIVGDHRLIGKMVRGDLIATEAKYHPACLLALYYKAARVLRAEEQTHDKPNDNVAEVDELNAESLALAEVIAFMEEVGHNELSPTVFKLSELSKLYIDQLARHNVKLENKVNTTRLKQRLLDNLPNLRAVSHGRDVFLTFSEHLGLALKHMKDTTDAIAVHMMHAAKLVRQEIFSCTSAFNGSFESTSQQDAVPQTLLTLVNMLLEGPGNFDNVDNQAALSISQLIIFNAVKRPRRKTVFDACSGTTSVRHHISQETPLPLYIGLMIHSATRKKRLVDNCHKLGLSVSYDRVLHISTKVANSVCAQYRCDDLVCPPVLQQGLFTVAAADNIDHNLSSSTAHSSFHGTAISLMQLPPLNYNLCNHTAFYSLGTASNSVSDIMLPYSYTDVSPCILPSKDPVVPLVQFSVSQPLNVMDVESDWLDTISNCIDDGSEPVNLSWSAYHADRNVDNNRALPITALLPLFRHSANTPAMMRHCLTVINAAVKKLNPNQVPVVTFDQPLFALVKQIQWHWPTTFGEDKFVIMMGGLHTEMAGLRMIGHWLDGSGWVQCLVQAGVATSGVSESFVHASHVKRTRYAHTVTAAALYICMKRCFQVYCEDMTENCSKNSFAEWRVEREQSSIQFRFWSTALELELRVLTFVHALREGNFSLYIESLQSMAPWFFAFDQTNYARWLPVHIRDMLSLAESHPSIFAEFQRGNFTVAKSHKRFSAISIDQAHEQLNALIKGDGGVMGLTESDAALSRWITAGPEILRILCEFEDNMSGSVDGTKHHEQKQSVQTKYRQDVTKLVQVFEDDNPFSETSANDLISLDTHTVADLAVSNSVTVAHDIGNKQFQQFVDDRLMGTVSVLAPLPRNKLPLFSFRPAFKRRDTSRLKVTELRTDCALFSQLYIACQSRDGDLDEFFRHENQPYPPSLSQHGSLRLGTKSDLLTCFSSLCENSVDISTLTIDTYILDGAVIVQMLRPGISKTFSEYREKIFHPYIKSLSRSVDRLDIVFDVYVPNSLKTATREKRGTGSKMRVTDTTKIPRNWQEFLRVDANKTELFHYLADLTVSDIFVKQLVITVGEQVRCSNEIDVTTVSPCTQEEADTRIMLHCLHASQCGSKQIAVRTVDTDVVVLAVYCFDKLNLNEMWIHFGVGKTVRLIPVHELAHALGPDKCAALPVFHCFTGCDTVSSFSGKGKKSAWETWNSYPVATQAFLNLHEVTDKIDEATLCVLERFVIIMYDRTSEHSDLDTARKHLFTKKSRVLELLPPTSDAFIQHVKRTVHQAVHCWGQCLQKQPQEHNPSDWGWIRDTDRWEPLWMTIPEVSQVCSELIHCKCKKGCKGNCKCVKANLSCTALCHCDGECSRH